jgi:DNA-binding CsgD family transcriptional regulator/PAS domain-containing protein
VGKGGTREAAGEQFIAAVEAIYDAAAAPEQWPLALQAVADAFGDVGANLTYHRDDGSFGAIVSPSLVAGVGEYVREWGRHDIRAQRALERGYFVGQDVITDHDVVSPNEIATHPFYTQFLAKFGLRWFAGINISPAPNISVAISIQRSLMKNPYTQAERATLVRLAQHAEKSLGLSIRLIDADVANLGLREALGRLGVGVFLLDGLGRVMFSNAAAERLLGDGLEIADKRLIARFSVERKSLDLAISTTAQLRGDLFPEDPRPILLPRPGANRPLVVYVLPLRSSLQPVLDQFLVGVRAIVLVIDAQAQGPADPALVRDLLGLTLGEARVAALVAAGIAPRNASEQLGISEETARTVLKRVFSKVGVSKQSELTALLTKMVLR